MISSSEMSREKTNGIPGERRSYMEFSRPAEGWTKWLPAAGRLINHSYLSSCVLAKYSLSISPSILFLITWGLGINLDLSCSVTWNKKK
jgi:hypothetical protein